MEEANLKRRIWTVVAAGALIALAPYILDARTENNIRLMTKACEQFESELLIEKISSLGSVHGRCVERSAD